jgi:peroxiredoxin
MRFSSPPNADGRRKGRRQLLKLAAGWVTLGTLGVAACDRDSPARGAPFPAFTLPDLAGASHDSREYAGKLLLVNFWATWCPPCRAEMADLEALQQQLGARGLQVLAISVDDDANLVQEYVRQQALALTVLVDAKQRWFGPLLRIPGLPSTFLVGSDGLIREAWLGPRAWADPAMQAELATRAGLR